MGKVRKGEKVRKERKEGKVGKVGNVDKVGQVGTVGKVGKVEKVGTGPNSSKELQIAPHIALCHSCLKVHGGVLIVF